LWKKKNEKKEVEVRILSLQTQKASDSHFFHSSHEILNFILNFEDALNCSDPFSMKTLVKKCIADVLVDKAENVIHLSTRILPAVTPSSNPPTKRNGSCNFKTRFCDAQV
jgi:hypothetical protein